MPELFFLRKCVSSYIVSVTRKPSCALVVLHTDMCMIMCELYYTNATLINEIYIVLLTGLDEIGS